MKRIFLMTFYLGIVTNAFSQMTKVIEQDNNLKKTGNSPFQTKLSSFLTNISVTSTFNQGENAEANINFPSNEDSTFVVGAFVNQKLGNSDDQQSTPFSLSDGLSTGTTIGLNLKFIISDAGPFRRFLNATAKYGKDNSVDPRIVTLAQVQNT